MAPVSAFPSFAGHYTLGAELKLFGYALFKIPASYKLQCFGFGLQRRCQTDRTGVSLTEPQKSTQDIVHEFGVAAPVLQRAQPEGQGTCTPTAVSILMLSPLSVQYQTVC